MFGSVLMVLQLIGELRFHAASTAAALGYAGGLLCLGAIAGLWLPRRVIQRRAARHLHQYDPSASTATDAASVNGKDLEFAAALVGVLALALAMVWLLLSGYSAALEDFRAGLVDRFVHPAALTLALLWGPAAVGLLLAGIGSATVLIALHGWQRLAAGARRPAAQLWLTALASAALAGMFASYGPGRGLPTIVALLAVFVAGILAVFRRPTGTIANRPAPLAEPEAAIDVIALLAAAVAAFSAGVAVLLALPSGLPSARDVGLSAACVAAAATAGLLLAHLPPHGRTGRATSPAALLLLAAGWMLPIHTSGLAAWPTPLRSALVVCCATLGVASAGRHLTADSHSMQQVLAGLGRAVATGLAAALLTGPLWINQDGSSASAVAAALLATAVAGLTFIADRRLRPVTRIGGLTLVSAALILVLLSVTTAGQPATPHTRDRVPPPPPAVLKAGRTLLTAGQLQTRIVPTVAKPGLGNRWVPWQIDLAGRHWDVVIFACPSDASADAPLQSDTARRVLRRCQAALLRKGRLIIELPNETLGRTVFDRAIRAALQSNWQTHYLRATCPAGVYEALALGPDIPAWIDGQPTPEGMKTTLCAISSHQQLDALRSAATAEAR
ncbi:MAG: hypothetical protein KKB50_19400 [Planctomycetes bacterium]|nr:hypothetical protein [Planctomycetota bacterium]